LQDKLNSDPNISGIGMSQIKTDDQRLGESDLPDIAHHRISLGGSKGTQMLTSAAAEYSPRSI